MTKKLLFLLSMALACALGGCASAPTASQIQATAVLKSSSQTNSEQEVLLRLAQALEQGADLNTALDDQGRTALMQASGLGHLRVIQFLLAHGADVNIRAADGTTAAYLALQHYKENPRLIETLIDARANLSALSPQGEPLITRFVRDGRCDWLGWSAAHADLNQRDAQGVPLAAKAWLSQDWTTTLCLLRLGAGFQYETTSFALSKSLALDQTDVRSEQFLNKKRVYQLAARAGIALRPLPGQP